MKKLYFLFLIASFLTFSFSGCKKDENEASIIGRWDLQKMKVDVYTNNSLKTSEEESTNLEMLYFVFKTNGQLAIHSENEPQADYTYTYQNDILKVTDEDTGEKIIWPITLLTRNALIFSEEETQVENSITYRIVTELHFKKQ